MPDRTSAGGAIVVGADGSAGAARAVRWAAVVAAQRNLPLHVINAYGPIGGFYGAGLPAPQEMFDAIEQEARNTLENAVAVAREVSTTLDISTEMPTEPAVPRLLVLAKRARMVVLGASGRGGFSGMRVGSTAVAVASHAECPVVVVRGEQHDGGPVVVGVDGSRVGERAIAVAFEEASWRRAPLIAVHAWSDGQFESTTSSVRVPIDWADIEDEEERLLAERLAGWQEKYPEVRVQRILVRDRPRHQLLEQSALAQLTVVGSRGRGGFTGLLLGSTGQALVQHARSPVMIVHPEPAE